MDLRESSDHVIFLIKSNEYNKHIRFQTQRQRLVDYCLHSE